MLMNGLKVERSETVEEWCDKSKVEWAGGEGDGSNANTVNGTVVEIVKERVSRQARELLIFDFGIAMVLLIMMILKILYGRWKNWRWWR